jgi:hypothetical protein
MNGKRLTHWELEKYMVRAIYRPGWKTTVRVEKLTGKASIAVSRPDPTLGVTDMACTVLTNRSLKTGNLTKTLVREINKLAESLWDFCDNKDWQEDWGPEVG